MADRTEERKLFAPDGSELNRNHDLTKDNRVKLGKYLSNRTRGINETDDSTFAPTDYQTSGRSNDFPIDGSTNEDLNLRSDGNRNYTLPETPSNQSTFASKHSVDRWSRSNDSESVGWKSVTQAERAGGEKDKRQVLSELPGSGDIVQVNEYSRKLKDGIKNVLNHNAFTQDRRFTSRTGDSSVQGWPAPSSASKIEEMRNAAMRVIGYSSGRNDANGNEFGALTKVGQAINLAPESAKKGIVGFRYSTGTGSSSDSFDLKSSPGPGEGFDGVPAQLIGTSNIEIPYPDDGLGNTGGIYSGFSYGSKNDSETPFGNLAKAPESTLYALAAAAAIFAAISVWSLVLTLLFQKLDRPEYRTGASPPGYERDTSVASDLLAQLFGTKRPYNVNTLVAGYEGAISFLGIDVVTAESTASAAMNFAFSPDYYILICRLVLNGVYAFAGQFTGGGSGVSPAGAVTALANLRSNKLVSFVNRMIDIGSITLRGVDTTTDTDNGLFGEEYSTSAMRRVSRSRQLGGRLSWRNEATAMCILPPNVVTNGSATMFPGDPNFSSTWASRISRRIEKVKIAAGSSEANEIEKELNSEYVPFFFRDLRTDEIISFHAFLADLSDQFTAGYTAVEGFGRQDPVQIYKGTTRSIGFSFYVVSTSPKDHDMMWYKINKLVSLLYPQYTDGIRVENSGNKFEVPFSQVYGASPLIRLRIGDVISSNYSRFGLARLFGLGKSGTSFSGGSDELNQQNIEKYNKVLTPELGGTGQSSTDTLAEILVNAGDSQQNNNLPTLNVPTDTPGKVIRGGIFRGVPDGGASILAAFERTYAVHIRPGTTGKIKILPFVPPFTENYTNRRETGNKSVCLLTLDKPVKVEPRDLSSAVTITQVYVPYEMLEFTQNYGERPVDVSTVSSVASKTKEFFSPKSNSIVQSFESSMGSGLAGVITSLSMDWNESTWETDKVGGKAPIWLKVTMQFAPIHDLPMGLDSTGVQIAPAYPVGDIVRRMSGIDVVKSDMTVNAGYTSNVDTDADITLVNGKTQSKDELRAPRYKKSFI